MNNKKIILTIATSDSGGGAGIQADLKTFSACSTYGVSVIVALTAQNHYKVHDIIEMPTQFIEQQMNAIFKQFDVAAIKIGMLFSEAIMNCIAKRLQNFKGDIVLDPVFVATSGAKLIKDNAFKALKEKLFPLASIITPNIKETSVLLDKEINSYEKMKEAAKSLYEKYQKPFLIKGGDLSNSDTSNDILISKNNMEVIEGKRIKDINAHGSGCTLSSAIAAFLGRGENLRDAVIKSKEYISQTMQQGYYLDKDLKVINHFIKE